MRRYRFTIYERRASAGRQAAPFKAPADEPATLISGSFNLGTGDKFDTSPTMNFSPGALPTPLLACIAALGLHRPRSPNRRVSGPIQTTLGLVRHRGRSCQRRGSSRRNTDCSMANSLMIFRGRSGTSGVIATSGIQCDPPKARKRMAAITRASCAELIAGCAKSCGQVRRKKERQGLLKIDGLTLCLC